MEYELIPDSLPSSTRSSITTSQTFFGAGGTLAEINQQLTAATGIRNTIVGYLFGKVTIWL